MSIFYQEDVPSKTKRGKCLASALKNAFSSKGKLPYSSPPQPQEPTNDFDQEHEVFVSAVMSRYMESKSKREWSNIRLCNFLGLSSEEYSIMNMITSNGDEIVSAGSHISISSSADFDLDYDDDDDAAFVSAKTCFSRCSSTLSNTDIDFKDMRKRWIILDCEGWPFGLCRKALLLPPLPKSPADSWSWNKTSGKIIKIHI